LQHNGLGRVAVEAQRRRPLKNPIILVALLVTASGLNFFAAEQKQPLPPQQQKQQTRMEIPPDAAFYQDVSWSPDGKALAFTLLKGGRWDVYAMRADGSQVTRLTNQEDVMNFYTSWSPDGRRIAFSARRGSEAKTDIYTINADGTGGRQLTTDPAGDTTPAWSPDGRRIAFVSERDGLQQIYVMNSDGSAQTRLTP
jgi:Tol biopolymer transport system component